MGRVSMENQTYYRTGSATQGYPLQAALYQNAEHHPLATVINNRSMGQIAKLAEPPLIGDKVPVSAILS